MIRWIPVQNKCLISVNSGNRGFAPNMIMRLYPKKLKVRAVGADFALLFGSIPSTLISYSRGLSGSDADFATCGVDYLVYPPFGTKGFPNQKKSDFRLGV
jgi:hypothetical protein